MPLHDNAIHTFHGYSKSTVTLQEGNDGKVFVRKSGEIGRNIERIRALKAFGLPFPELHYVDLAADYYDMEFIHGLDMKTYLLRNPVTPLLEFLSISLNKMFSTFAEMHDYSEIIRAKTDFIKWHPVRAHLPFTQDELLACMPTHFNKSVYFGDLTLENILWDTKRERFVFIDAATIEYDSCVFDIAKLSQDVVSRWFIRRTNVRLDAKLHKLYSELKYEFECDGGFDPRLQILMLLRVLPHARIREQKDVAFLIEKIEELWNNVK